MVKEVERLAAFVHKRGFRDLTQEAILALKMRLLDSLGCAFGAIGAEPIAMIKEQLDDFGGKPLVTLIGGGKNAPDRAAFYNGALIRYLDYNDSFLAKHETCHPSDNVAPVLAACEYVGGSGEEFLTALAVSYQVQCRLSEEAPVRKKGFDHTTQGAYAASAGVAKALRLPQDKIANAIAISGVVNNSLRVTRTGALSHWKGLAYPHTAFTATHAAFLAYRGITGPLEVFEGNKGFKEAISGPFTIDWEKESLEAVLKTIIKKYNAEIHSQSTLEGILELRQKGLKAEEVERIEVDIFDVAFHIIGGGEEGEKKEIRTKEEADHSLPYMIAVALLDGDVGPSQYTQERIVRPDVQHLLRKVHIHPRQEYTERFPYEMPASIRVLKKNGAVIAKDKQDYGGFFTRPMTWQEVEKKFRRLASSKLSSKLCVEISEMVLHLEKVSILDLTNLLGKTV